MLLRCYEEPGVARQPFSPGAHTFVVTTISSASGKLHKVQL